jgi:transcriptional regulator with XRE-family HTH domain
MPNNKIFFDSIAFGQRLGFLRKKQGLTQSKLAQELGYKRGGSISNMESGKTMPDLKSLAKIAQIFNTDLHWLVLGKSSPGIERWREKCIDLSRAINTLASLDDMHTNEKKGKISTELMQLTAKESRGDGTSPERVRFLQEELERLNKHLLENKEELRKVMQCVYGEE